MDACTDGSMTLPLLGLLSEPKKQKHTFYYPVLNPKDLEEKFTLGSGPGGLADNRTANAMPSSSNISQLVNWSGSSVIRQDQ